jgi:LPXTG-motif cell wall-anchored protein
VVVTATLDPGLMWPDPMPPAWTETSETTASYSVTFAAVSCAPATPLDPGVDEATCASGEVTEPTITAQDSPGVTYSFDPEGPYDGTVDTTVTVTATLDDGYEWTDPLPGDWDLVDPVTATVSIVLEGATCVEVTPAAPENHAAECIDGEVTRPTLTFPDTDGITYTTDVQQPYSPGQTVVVTATLTDEGVGWPAEEDMPAGWTITTPTTAIYTNTFADVTCTPATPLDPDVAQAGCVNGRVTAPTITPTPTPGITYAVTPGGSYDGTVDHTVTVTATLDDGFEWVDPLPDGWTLVDSVTATFTVELAASSCQIVTPALPAIDEAECVDGALTEPTLTITPTAGIRYSTDAPTPYAPGQTVVVTAALESTGVAWPTTLPDGWTWASPSTATYTVTFADVSCPPATPLNPGVVQATCVDGVVSAPTITPTNTTGISYLVMPDGPYDGTVTTMVTVTATLADGYAWVDPLPTGWTQVDLVTATFTVTLTATTCAEVTPAAPAIGQAGCVGGALTEPTLTVPTTDGVTYTADAPSPYAPGQTVVVTATLAGAGVAWPATLPDGWTETSPTTATYTVTFADVTCAPATPLDPGVAPADCVNGVVGDHTITPTPVDGVTYSLDPSGPYDGALDYSVTVTATLADGYAWITPAPAGWTYADDMVTATFTVELAGAKCVGATLVVPGVDDADCVDGGLTDPTLTLPDTPGVTYGVNANEPYAPGQTVIVTATLDSAGVGWPPQAEMPAGWTITTPTTAEYTVTFADMSCTPATPLNPDVVPATCANGEVTEPTIVPQATDGITYGADPPGPYEGTEDVEVTVTATLGDGYAWGDSLPTGWTQIDLVTADFTVELVGATCDEVTPVVPENHAAECVDGALTEPTLTLPETDGITYTTDVDAPYAPGQTVLVTATLDDDGVAWPENLPPDWSETSTATATYTHTFADVSCAPVTPLDPVVAQATCVVGRVTAPTVTPVPTQGISFNVDPAGPYDGASHTAVTVTATLADGFAWVDPMTDGWTQVDLMTATFTVELAGATCTEVVPLDPANHDAVCVDGVLTPPTLTFPNTEGITYTVSADPPYEPGQTVIITATLDGEGVSWSTQLPEGWVQMSATTATSTHTFVDVECTAVTPVAPEVAYASCVDGAVVPPTVTLATTTGIVYTVVPAGPYDGLAETEVVVTATLDEGYAWGDSGPTGPLGFAGQRSIQSRLTTSGLLVMALPPGWIETSPTTATFTLNLPATPDCPPPTTASAGPATSSASGALPPTGLSGALPATGADGTDGKVAIAALLLVAGAGLVLIVRRRVA